MNPHPDLRHSPPTGPSRHSPPTGPSPHSPPPNPSAQSSQLPSARVRANAQALGLATLLLSVAVAGCIGGPPSDCQGTGPIEYHEGPAPTATGTGPCTAYIDLGFDGIMWPDLSGRTLTIIDHGAFDAAFAAAKPLFENLTGARVEHHAAQDAGTALELAIRDHDRGGGSFDVIYGLDQPLLPLAADAGILVPYTPVLADRVDAAHRFTPTQGDAWLATPVDRGYIAINVDPRAGITIDTLEDLVAHADRFVTEDPRFSSPGLGFLVATVAAYGEDSHLDYWTRLFDAGITVSTDWSEAYADRFSGGYGQFSEGTRLDKAIVTSYTTSPAYEMYYEYDIENDVLTAPGSTYEQIQTMAILEGADMAAAQAWIEFTLTDDFQRLAAPYNAIYPVVSDADVDASVRDVYQDIAPDPGALEPATFPPRYLADNVGTWVRAWTDLYEAHRA